MRLARSIMMNALTKLVSRNAEPNAIEVACKQQRAMMRFCTSAQAVSFNGGRYSSVSRSRADDLWYGIGRRRLRNTPVEIMEE